MALVTVAPSQFPSSLVHFQPLPPYAIASTVRLPAAHSATYPGLTWPYCSFSVNLPILEDVEVQGQTKVCPDTGGSDNGVSRGNYGSVVPPFKVGLN